jgi:hypothetical protein
VDLPSTMTTGNGFSLIFMDTKSGEVYYKVRRSCSCPVSLLLNLGPSADGQVPDLCRCFSAKQLYNGRYVSP